MIAVFQVKEGQRLYKAIRDSETHEWFVGEAEVEKVWKTPKRGDLRANLRAVNFSSNGKDRWTIKGVSEKWFSTPLEAVETAIYHTLLPSPYDVEYKVVTICANLEEEVCAVESLIALWRSLRKEARNA